MDTLTLDSAQGIQTDEDLSKGTLIFGTYTVLTDIYYNGIKLDDRSSFTVGTLLLPSLYYSVQQQTSSYIVDAVNSFSTTNATVKIPQITDTLIMEMVSRLDPTTTPFTNCTTIGGVISGGTIVTGTSTGVIVTGNNAVVCNMTAGAFFTHAISFQAIASIELLTSGAVLFTGGTSTNNATSYNVTGGNVTINNPFQIRPLQGTTPPVLTNGSYLIENIDTINSFVSATGGTVTAGSTVGSVLTNATVTGCTAVSGFTTIYNATATGVTIQGVTVTGGTITGGTISGGYVNGGNTIVNSFSLPNTVVINTSTLTIPIISANIYTTQSSTLYPTMSSSVNGVNVFSGSALIITINIAGNTPIGNVSSDIFMSDISINNVTLYNTVISGATSSGGTLTGANTSASGNGTDGTVAIGAGSIPTSLGYSCEPTTLSSGRIQCRPIVETINLTGSYNFNNLSFTFTNGFSNLQLVPHVFTFTPELYNIQIGTSTSKFPIYTFVYSGSSIIDIKNGDNINISGYSTDVLSNVISSFINRENGHIVKILTPQGNNRKLRITTDPYKFYMSANDSFTNVKPVTVIVNRNRIFIPLYIV